ncbi:MAG: SRPBCC family protein [Bacillota bacterium]
MKSLMVERTVKVPLEKVWDAVDFTKSQGPYPVVVEKEGDPALHGLGAQRMITFGKQKVRESLVEIDPPHSYSYSILSGSPVKSYLGKAEFIAGENGTIIKWSGEFIPIIPGIGWIVAKVTKKYIHRIIDELEKSS